MFFKSSSVVLGATLLVSSAVQADCRVSDVTGTVGILGNEFPAIQSVVADASECASDALSVSSNLTKEHRDLQVPALTADPSEYSSAIVANSSITALMNDNLIRPLNEYVEKYGAGISDTQKIVVDGNVMAIAFMANAQHLMYRKDILEQIGMEPPATYEDMITAAAAIKEQSLMEYPLTGTYKSGWNLGEEFVNMYMGYDGELFKPGSAEPSLQNDKAVAALNMMKSLTEYMNPDFLTFDSTAAAAEFEQGKAAIMNMWGSRAGSLLDEEGAVEGVAENIGFAAAPTVGGGSTPASTLWWDGFTIAKNVSDEDAEATFQILAGSLNADMANTNGDDAVWLIDGYVPTATDEGVLATAQANAKPYPMLPYIGLMHTALGDELVEFLQGSESAEKALEDVEAAYITAAKEGGFL
ncbi:MAG: extracellular solute-binding protein [Granulosicoccus sp.]|nr:extracellular solute-binding protein [Granulosicoccus sp.]